MALRCRLALTPCAPRTPSSRTGKDITPKIETILDAIDCDDATGRRFEVTDLSNAEDRDPALYEFVSLATWLANPPGALARVPGVLPVPEPLASCSPSLGVNQTRKNRISAHPVSG